ncbi:hypothetical protein M430DRAFT_266494 [Amorphotheca resinae ATCC 22711]|uniref:Uncharacterized protein n=1 Tax=Amorphotheca resinae ATCC 22711 TaxID=857342 RepID=A0A2T3AX26_AMORE|nr:hypothetical protein M430DRAFT_266494 [Amorphotheca resinae ATCC 22711]PSS13226.1 hypothetical protein M430DRAFT_266494 [Amorphotheca resinae ATCC 22711]
MVLAAAVWVVRWDDLEGRGLFREYIRCNPGDARLPATSNCIHAGGASCNLPYYSGLTVPQVLTTEMQSRLSTVQRIAGRTPISGPSTRPSRSLPPMPSPLLQAPLLRCSSASAKHPSPQRPLTVSPRRPPRPPLAPLLNRYTRYPR